MSFQPDSTPLEVNAPPPSVDSRALGALFDISDIADGAGLGPYLKRVLDGIVEWFAASSTSLFLRSEDDGRFTLAATSGTSGRLPEDAFVEADKGIAGESIATGEPMLLDGRAMDALVTRKHIQIRKDISSSMVIPLLAPRAGCIGVLNVARSPGRPPLLESDLRLARALAGHIALAVSNARLLEGLKSALDESSRLKLRFERLVAIVGVGLIVVGRDRKIVAANPEAERMLGSAARVGRPLRARSAGGGALPSALARVVTESLQGIPTRADVVDPESGRAFAITASPMPDFGAAVSIQETTDQIRAEKELARIRRLAELGQIAASIAHEIRNPLTGIRGAAQVIRDSPAEAAEFSQIIDDEVCKLNALCEDFLEFARPVRLRLGQVNLLTLAQGCAKVLEAEFKRERVSLHVENLAQKPIIVGDALRIEQVMRNLLLNAVQSSASGSRVTVRLTEDGFEVEDQGKGMDDDTMKRLFTPFFTTRTGGTGLGLSNVRRILDAHGATVDVASSPGKGTRFKVKFGGQPQ